MGFAAVIKYSDQKQLKRKGFLHYHSSKEVMVGAQNRNQRGAAYWFVLRLTFRYLSYSLQDYLIRCDKVCPLWAGPPHINQKMSGRHVH